MIDTIVGSELFAFNEQSDSNMLGMLKYFVPYSLSASGQVQTQITAEVGLARFCINRHSAAILPGQIVLINTDAEGPYKAVEGPTSGASAAAGVVPWSIPAAGVPVGGTFWLIIKGVCYVQSDGGNDVSAGGLIEPAASGRMSAHTAGTNDIYCCGRAIEAIGSTAGALKLAHVNFTLA